MSILQLTPDPGRTGQLYYLRGDDKRVVARNLDLGDVATVQRAIDQARQQYPTQALKLGVYRANGSAKVLDTTLDIPSSALAGPADALASDPDPVSTPSPYFPRPAAASSAPAGLDNFSAYLLSEKDTRIREKDDTIRELRDHVRIQDDTIRGLKDKNDQLNLENRFKDREHELALAGVEASRKTGLAGLGESLSGLPPELITMIGAKLLGGVPALPAAAPGLQLGGLSPGHQGVIEAVVGILQQADEATATQLYYLVQHLVQHPAVLAQFLQSINPHA